MPVTYDRGRLIGQLVTRLEEGKPQGEVLASAGFRPRAEGAIETAELPEHVGPQCHVHAGPELTRGLGEQGLRWAVLAEVEQAAREGAGETDMVFKDLLGSGVKVGWQGQAGDA